MDPNFSSFIVNNGLNSQNYESLIEEQKNLLLQFPNAFQESDHNSTDDDIPLTEFEFKCLPKFKVFKTIIKTKTIVSLSDIGFEIDFNIKPNDLFPNFCEDVLEIRSQMPDMTHDFSLKTLLKRNSLKMVLRFSYIEDIYSKEQKDKIPEHLCIECNNQRVFTYEENYNKSTPFNLSKFCCFYQNKVKIRLLKPNYVFLMPCITEISVVHFETSNTLLSKLKQNNKKVFIGFMGSTKQMIVSQTQQISDDEIICIIPEMRVKLFCPLSLRRIKTPCRTSDCQHIQCFDAFTFFKANKYSYDWFCPICKKAAHFDKLIIDGYLTEVLNSTNDKICEVIIKSDGNYETIESLETEESDDNEEKDINANKRGIKRQNSN